MKLLLLGAIALLVCGIFSIVRPVMFNQGCGNYLERASNANSIELAYKNMSTAIDYLERNHLTNGNSSVLWNMPRNDVGYWYANLIATRDELNIIPANASSLEKSNVLMKLRETLLSNGSEGESIVKPSNISFYPFQRVWWITCTVLLLVFGMTSAIEFNNW